MDTGVLEKWEIIAINNWQFVLSCISVPKSNIYSVLILFPSLSCCYAVSVAWDWEWCKASKCRSFKFDGMEKENINVYALLLMRNVSCNKRCFFSSPLPRVYMYIIWIYLFLAYTDSELKWLFVVKSLIDNNSRSLWQRDYGFVINL